MTAPLRVRLRPAELADGDIFYQHQLNPAAQQMAAFTAPDPSDRVAYMEKWHRIFHNERITIRAIILDASTTDRTPPDNAAVYDSIAPEVVVGQVASFPRDDRMEVTYWIDCDYWGRGIATAALKLLLDEVTARPIFGGAALDNAASIRVLEKCGFKMLEKFRGFSNARKAEIDECVMRLD